MKPPMIPLTSHTPRLHQHALRYPWHGATQTHFPPKPRKSQWHCDITNVLWPHFALQLCKLFPALLFYTNWPLLSPAPKSSFPYYNCTTILTPAPEKLFPALHLYCKLATSESSSEKLLPALHLHYELARSESSSTSAVCVSTTLKRSATYYSSKYIT